MNDYNKQYRKNDYGRWMIFGTWLLAIAGSLTIWYLVGKAFYSLYLYTHSTKKIEFRYGMGFQKPQ